MVFLIGYLFGKLIKLMFTFYINRLMTTLKILTYCLLISAILCRISIKNRTLYDEQGRQLRIHGTNVVVKVPPYMPRIDSYDPEWSFSQQDMINCTAHGYNGIRLGMMWAGVQDKKDIYNETYLDNMEKLINNAGRHGIYTLIDYHQDLMSEKFCGDGVPTWLATDLNLYRSFPTPLGKRIPLNDTGLPDWNNCDQNGWGKYYFSFDVGHAFAQLYRKDSPLNLKFTAFWSKIANKFKDNPYILGYELINEPFVGNALKDVFLIVPSVAERLKFQDFYDRLTQQIRKIDPNTPIFFEPITFDNAVPAGFNYPPAGNRYRDLSVFSYHFYKPPALGLNTIDYRVKDGKRLGVLSFLSEFSDSSSEVLQRAQKYQQSWLHWQYKSYGKGWGSPTAVGESLNANLSMTYLQRIAGHLIDEEFNFNTKHYVAHYIAKPRGISVLYFCQRLNYPNGHSLQLHPLSLLAAKETRPGYYQITYSGTQNTMVQISITAL